MNTTLTITVELSPQTYKYDDIAFHTAIKEVLGHFSDVDPMKLAELLHYESHCMEQKALGSMPMGMPPQEME